MNPAEGHGPRATGPPQRRLAMDDGSVFKERLTAAIPMENPYCSCTMDGRQCVFVQQCAGRR